MNRGSVSDRYSNTPSSLSCKVSVSIHSTVPQLTIHWLPSAKDRIMTMRNWRAIHGAVKQSLFVDRTLQWARQNPQLAQRCLDVPPLDGVAIAAASSPPTNPHASAPPRTFVDYWNRRGWTFDSLERVEDRILGQNLATHVLTGPLTLASKLLRPLDVSQRNSDMSNDTLRVRVCCAGARAEASLPVQYWREVLVLLKWSSPAVNVALTIDFVGPDVVVGRKPVHFEHGGSTLQLRWPFAGKFHDYVAIEGAVARDSSRYHGIVLFNPGLGHPNLKADWRPTIDLLLGRRRQSRESASVLLTAHSEVDANRESTYLKEDFGLTIDYSLNPFASEITYEDPFDNTHVVRPNHFAAMF